MTKDKLCACGCGAPVRRSYLPGHDAKHKAVLLREAKGEGAAAKRAQKELTKRGWSRFNVQRDNLKKAS